MEAIKNKRLGGRPSHQPSDKDRQMAEVLANEIDPRYVDVIVRRFEEYAGTKAK